MKCCSKCGEIKDLISFYKHPQTKDKLQSQCKMCSFKNSNLNYNKNKLLKNNPLKDKTWYSKNKEKAKIRTKIWRQNNKERKHINSKTFNIKKRFGLTIEQYDKISEELWISQKGKCAICEMQASSYGKHSQVDPNTLHLDHSHKTGIIRALLCTKCNKALGLLKDDFSILHKASIYLQKYEHVYLFKAS